MERKYKCTITNCIYNRYKENSEIQCPFNGELRQECKELWLHDSFVNENTLASYYYEFRINWLEQNNPDLIIQCAACGYKTEERFFYNSSVHKNFKICPICGTVKFTCKTNRGYRVNQKKV